MHSIRTRITVLTVCAIIVVMIVTAVSGVVAIRNIGTASANQTLQLLCETGQKNLNHYFESAEMSVDGVYAFAEKDLGEHGANAEQFSAHVERVSDVFKKLTAKTNGVLTYYYRIDPQFSSTEKGFWYVNTEGEGFIEHEVTDITQYDTEDTNALVWFTIPKKTGEPVWLPSYITDNLDARVVSYNIPIYYEGQFVGVIGIELDYFIMAAQVDSITLYDNGYAFINDKDGKIIYHPKMNVTKMDEHPTVPTGMIDDDEFIRYNYEGVDKQAVRLKLLNGMYLTVSVPVWEINASWIWWIVGMLFIFAVLMVIFVLLTLQFAGHITKPLRELTKAAEQVDAGNYDYTLEYNYNDEVGILSRTFKNLTTHLKSYISDLNDLAYADSLTSLHNKGAFDVCVKDIQKEISDPGKSPEFAICIFDCNDLKKVNDQNGHDKGDIYLKEAADIICEVFGHSPVFRIGGDEFAAILLDRDFAKREELIRRFDEVCAEKRKSADTRWEQVDISRGMAVFDPSDDVSVSDVVRRADKLMYENKWLLKEKRAKNENSN